MNNSKTGLFHQPFFFLTLCSLFFLFGCSPTNKIHPEFKKRLNNQYKIGLIDMRSQHAGSSAKSFLGSFLGGLVGSAIVASITANDVNLPYPQQLDKNVLKAIENSLMEQDHFRYVMIKNLKNPYQIVEKNPSKPQLETIKQFIGNNNLNAAMLVQVNYDICTGIVEKVCLDTSWTIFGQNGLELAVINTMTEAQKGKELFPNTLDPSYEKVFLQFAINNTNSLIQLLQQ